MKTASLLKGLEYNKSKPVIKVLFDTSFTKEIRIAMKAGTAMKKHQTGFPIVIEMVDGHLDFGVNNETLDLQKGDLIALEAGVPHDLKAKTDCIVRLTLTKYDTPERVENLTKK
ncbi:MAG: cupin domain-containing protein [Flavobacteriales bacterium]